MRQMFTLAVSSRKPDRVLYDSLDCKFIKELLICLKFPGQFMNWIMVCISTPSYSLSFNGGLCGFF